MSRSGEEFRTFSIRTQSDIHKKPKTKRSDSKQLAEARSIRARIQRVEEKKELLAIAQEFDGYD
jgi:hypothetical protein